MLIDNSTNMLNNNSNIESNTSVKFLNEIGEELNNAPIVVPCNTNIDQLQKICTELLKTFYEKKNQDFVDLDEPLPITFKTDDGIEIIDSLSVSLDAKLMSSEKVIRLLCLPQAVFRVFPVTRCTSSMPGHQQPIISAQFSPDGKKLASGSGDKTVRLWDLNTELPLKTCEGHIDWVLCISWSPNGKKLASASRKGTIIIWDPNDGKLQKKLSGHKGWVRCLAWNPLHQDLHSRLLASSSHDTTIRIWDTVQGLTVKVLSGHTASITCIKWGGCGLLYSSSHDRTIKVWRVEDGVMCRSLSGHGHWINSLALNVDYVLRTSCFEPNKNFNLQIENNEAIAVAKKRYESVLHGEPERLVSGSDDFTLFLWEPSEKKQHVERMTGHQQLINQVMFSPDARYIASASFDKSIKLWDGRTGKFITTLRGHVSSVYQISWSADSRLLVSGSADSTLKVWQIKTGKLLLDLPGHADQVFAVDWSPDGERVASGGKDTVLKLWRR